MNEEEIHLTDVRITIPRDILQERPWLRSRILEILGEGFLDKFGSCFGKKLHASITIQDGKEMTKCSNC